MDEKLNEIIKKAKHGNKEAFEKLYRHHIKFVYSVIIQKGFKPSEADDLAQEVFYVYIKK